MAENRKKYKIGYTQGVFDMFHIGHLHLINSAAAQCEQLIVGVNTDRLVQEYKKKNPVIVEEDRAEIIRNLKNVAECVIVDTLDKVVLQKQLGFQVVFIGDDWKGNLRWEQTEQKLKPMGIDVVYLPHTPNISSTMLRVEIPQKVEE